MFSEFFYFQVMTVIVERLLLYKNTQDRAASRVEILFQSEYDWENREPSFCVERYQESLGL
jgi:hypothetical protein